MTEPPEKAGIPGLPPALETKLLDIPDEKFAEVVRLLERVRDHPDVRQTFATIRPRLIQTRPDRRPTLKRVLCMPFEDVLESPGGRGKVEQPLGRIERRAIEPVWRLVAERADQAVFERLDHQVRETAPGNRNALLNIGRVLWPMAAGILHAAAAENGPLRGDAPLRRQVEEIAGLLDIGLIVEALKSDLSPKPVPALEEEHTDAIERAAQAAARQAPDTVYGLLRIAAARLANPADLLTVLPDLDLGRAKRDLPAILSRLGGLVVGHLEERIARPDGAGDAPPIPPEEAVVLAEQLLASVTATGAAMERRSDPAYRGRLDAVKRAVGAMVSGSVLKTAATGILSAVPAPPLAGPPVVDEPAQIAAEDHARALRRSAGLAEALGLQQPVDDTLKAMGNGLIEQAQALLDAYPRLMAHPDDADAAETNLYYVLRLLEMVAGPGKAESLRLAIMASTAGRYDD
ncbi:hypothetical protein MCW82_27135 [Azospirillum doebereinerae]|uniref:hypothetical protein n=1 Tax=Azospirillum doebereinerae TaxID=92933 RepID=UPI001EE5A545|nr:hypothetical protein [Azospirillum doebereinerae]MCG5243459.1 hypothetical protein [Azospirillum doebereinerae]